MGQFRLETAPLVALVNAHEPGASPAVKTHQKKLHEATTEKSVPWLSARALDTTHGLRGGKHGTHYLATY